MKRTTTLLAALMTGLFAASAVQASPFLLFDQLLGSADALSGDQDHHWTKWKILSETRPRLQQQDGSGGNPSVTTLETGSGDGSGPPHPGPRP